MKNGCNAKLARTLSRPGLQDSSILDPCVGGGRAYRTSIRVQFPILLHRIHRLLDGPQILARLASFSVLCMTQLRMRQHPFACLMAIFSGKVSAIETSNHVRVLVCLVRRRAAMASCRCLWTRASTKSSNSPVARTFSRLCCVMPTR